MRPRDRRRGTLAGVTSDRVRRPVVAAAIDGVCLAVFVLLGRSSHGLNGGSNWFLTVLWPFVVGFYAAALVTHLYTAATHPWRRAAATVTLGVVLALLVRVTATSRSTPVVFGVVAFSFLMLTTVGWRVAARFAARLRVRVSA
jgi:Protein of unknown function (DUF3054)